MKAFMRRDNVDVLLENNANIEAKDNKGETVLFKALR